MNCFPEPDPDALNDLFPPIGPDPSTLGGWVKLTRRACHMSQKDLARRCDVPFKYISDLENGRLSERPTTATLVQIAKALDMDVNDLFERWPADAK